VVKTVINVSGDNAVAELQTKQDDKEREGSSIIKICAIPKRALKTRPKTA